jgi:hypothetical protein
MLAVRAGGHRRGSPGYSYNAGSAGLVDGAGYPAPSWGVGFCYCRDLVGGLKGAARHFIKNMEKSREVLRRLCVALAAGQSRALEGFRVVPLKPARPWRGDTSSHTRTSTLTHPRSARTRTRAAGQSRSLEGWCPCSRRVRYVEIRLEMCITSGNPK